MKNVFRSISALCALVVVLVGENFNHAGFELIIDNANARQVGQFFEVDAYFHRTGDTPSQIKEILLSLVVNPANPNDPPDSIAGVRFAGLINPTTNALFTDPLIPAPDINGFTMVASLRSPAPQPAVDGAKAFTALLQSTSSTPANVQVEFLIGMYRVTNQGTEFSTPFESLSSTGSFTISAVPEPGTCLLASIGLGGIALSKRHLRRQRRVRLQAVRR